MPSKRAAMSGEHSPWRYAKRDTPSAPSPPHRQPTPWPGAIKSDNTRLEWISDELVDYTRYHVETDEAVWHSHLAGNALEVSHQDTHRGFIETELRLKSEQATRPLEELAEEALGFLARWLVAHILETGRYMAYIVLAMEDGMPPDQARQDADAKMSGATRVLIGSMEERALASPW